MIEGRDAVLDLGTLLGVVVDPSEVFLVALLVLVAASHEEVLDGEGAGVAETDVVAQFGVAFEGGTLV